MASFSRYSRLLMAGSACVLLASCGGADSVASPGAGAITIINPATPAPTPTPTGTPTPTALTASQFAAQTTVNGITVTSQEQLDLVDAGANNNVNGTNILNGVYPTNATPVTAADPTRLGSFFTPANFIGATSGPNDNNFVGWTCNSTAANFGSGSASCTAVPSIGSPVAGSCPTGTIDDGTNSSSSPTFRYCRLPQIIDTDLSLPKVAGVVYRFRGQTEVGNVATGATATLNIAAGVVLAADSSESTNDLLLVNRGSKINAVGTASAPIVFTAQQNLASNGVSDATQGLWGGIVLLGRAPTAVCAAGTGPNNADGTSATCQNPIEGVTNRFYGGTNQADSSGTMQYVQIRYTGIAISEGNELQGLTLGGVGSGTTLDHIQSHNSADDGVEIFGGTANMKYMVMTGADDDGFDIDNGYRGFIQFMITAQKPLGATADSFSTEIDSNGAEDLLPRTFARYANFTFIQTATAPAAIRLRGGADMAFVNGIVKTPQGVACVNMVAGEDNGGRTTVRAANAALQDVGPPTFNSVYFECQGR